MKIFPLLALGVLLLTSCGNVQVPGAPSTGDTASGDAEPAPTAGPDLDGHVFLGSEVTDGGASHELVEGTQIRLAFESGQLSAQAGCNTMFGGYQFDGVELVVDGLAMTQMGCAEDLADQDTWLSGVLSARPAVSLEGDELTLTSGGTVITLTDRAVADPDRPLVGTVWRVESLISGDAVSSVPAGVEASLTFGEDRSVKVQGGCNRGMTTYTVEDGTLTLGPVALTRMACPGDRGDVEQAVLEVLEAGTLTYEIVADRLTLTGDGSGLGLRAG